jgi:hypothetical protein
MSPILECILTGSEGLSALAVGSPDALQFQLQHPQFKLTLGAREIFHEW